MGDRYRRTREGKVYCTVVLVVFSRRVVGWSIDTSPTSGLVTSATLAAVGAIFLPLGLAARRRRRPERDRDSSAKPS
ncbi:MAG: hypothetical protein ACRDWA_17260 [Acidimicrobiia bacterium]